MGVQHRIQTQLVNGVTVVTFVDPELTDATPIQELGDELFALVEQDGVTAMVIDLQAVEFLSSAALNKLYYLRKKVQKIAGAVHLCNLMPEIQEVFVITKYNLVFNIYDSVEDALDAFER